MLLRLILLSCVVLDLMYGAHIANVENDDDDGWDEIENASNETVNVRTPTVEAELVLTRAVASSDSDASECTTHDGNTGSCIPIKECKQLNDLLKYKFQQPGIPELLRKSQCGDRNSLTRYVCCPASVRKTSPQQSAGTFVKGDKRKTSLSLGKKTTTATSPSNNRQCGNRSISAVRVVAGRQSELGAWPWMAALFCSNDQGKLAFQCGGSLISNQWVLTASHCLKCGDKSSTLSYVRLGDLDLRENADDKANPIDIQIKQTVQHPKYVTSPIQNDIALLKLSQPVEFSTHIYPICLFSGESYTADDFYLNKRPFVAGWGTTEFGTASSVRLMEAKIPTVELSQCEKNYVNQKTQAMIDKRVLCAGDGTHDSCSGDSGGPLMFYNSKKKQFYQGGVVSFGIRCAEKDFPGVYTKVASFIDWINEITGLAF